MNPFTKLTILILGALALAACMAPPSTTPRSVAPSGPGIGISLITDICPDLVIERGQFVAWTNMDTVARLVRHQAAGAAPVFDSGALQPGEAFEYRFSEPGEYPYICTEGDDELGYIRVN